MDNTDKVLTGIPAASGGGVQRGFAEPVGKNSPHDPSGDSRQPPRSTGTGRNTIESPPFVRHLLGTGVSAIGALVQRLRRSTGATASRDVRWWPSIDFPVASPGRQSSICLAFQSPTLEGIAGDRVADGRGDAAFGLEPNSRRSSAASIPSWFTSDAGGEWSWCSVTCWRGTSRSGYGDRKGFGQCSARSS
jgi:hypothetical protein